MANLNTTALAGPQFYPYCVNIEVINGGSATPEGVNIPGAYKAKDYGIAFSPYMTYKDTDTKEGTAHNSKYVCPMLFPFFESPALPAYLHSHQPLVTLAFVATTHFLFTSLSAHSSRFHRVPQNTLVPTRLPPAPPQPLQKLELIHLTYKSNMMHW
jgi:hypothetical protein